MELQDLIGKTISAADKMSKEGFEDEKPYLRLGFTDRTHCFIEAGFGSWSDEAIIECEYPRFIEIRDNINE